MMYWYRKVTIILRKRENVRETIFVRRMNCNIKGMLETLTFQHSLSLTLLLDEINVYPIILCRFNFFSIKERVLLALVL